MNVPQDKKAFYSFKEAAEILGIKRYMIGRAVKAGELETYVLPGWKRPVIKASSIMKKLKEYNETKELQDNDISIPPDYPPED